MKERTGHFSRVGAGGVRGPRSGGSALSASKTSSIDTHRCKGTAVACLTHAHVLRQQPGKEGSGGVTRRSDAETRVRRARRVDARGRVCVALEGGSGGGAGCRAHSGQQTRAAVRGSPECLDQLLRQRQLLRRDLNVNGDLHGDPPPPPPPPPPQAPDAVWRRGRR